MLASVVSFRIVQVKNLLKAVARKKIRLKLNYLSFNRILSWATVSK